MEPIMCIVRHTDETSTTFSCMGRLSMDGGDTSKKTGIDYFRETMKTVIKRERKLVLLDLKRTDHIDREGLNEISNAHSKIKETGGRMKLLNPNERVREFLTKAGMIPDGIEVVYDEHADAA